MANEQVTKEVWDLCFLFLKTIWNFLCINIFIEIREKRKSKWKTKSRWLSWIFHLITTDRHALNVFTKCLHYYMLNFILLGEKFLPKNMCIQESVTKWPILLFILHCLNVVECFDNITYVALWCLHVVVFCRLTWAQWVLMTSESCRLWRSTLWPSLPSTVKANQSRSQTASLPVWNCHYVSMYMRTVTLVRGISISTLFFNNYLFYAPVIRPLIVWVCPGFILLTI